jgi:thiamine-monophosphate kinase
MGITIFGEVPQGQMIKRSGAQVGDDVYVSGSLGDARWALMALKGQLTMNAQHLSFARERLEMPTPRVALGLALRGLASAAMDLSDGFLGDIKHLLKRSQKGAQLDAQRMLESDLISPALRTLGQREALMMALQGGDDYELLFTASKDKRADIEALARDLALPLTAIGEVTENEGLTWVNTQALGGTEDFADLSSYDHFL